MKISFYLCRQNQRNLIMTITLIVLAVLTLAAGFVYFSARRIRRMPEVAQSQLVLTLDSNNFNKQIQSGVTLVDFWASWCMPCKMMSPILNEVANEVSGKATVGKLNVDEQKQVAAKYRVRSIPTLILFRNGKEVDRIVGVKPKDYLVRKIEMAKFS